MPKTPLIGSTSRQVDYPPPIKLGNFLFLGKRTLTARLQHRLTEKEIKELIQTDVHTLAVEDVLLRFKTRSDKGLSHDDAVASRLQGVPNLITPAPKSSEVLTFILRHRNTMFLLTLAMVFCFVTDSIYSLRPGGSFKRDYYYLGIVLVFVTIFSGSFCFYHQKVSERQMDSFRDMYKKFAKVIRGGKELSLQEHRLVVGDLVVLKAGDIVPADIRLIESENMKVNNFPLTANAEIQIKSTSNTSDDPLETENLVYFGTHCVEGTGRGVVYATGDNTALGQVTKRTQALQLTETPLFNEIRNFVRMRIYGALFLGVMTMSVSVMLSFFWPRAVSLLLVLLISNMPEILLTILTTSLTQTAKVLTTKNCLVKDLEAVENLGACSVVCMDKSFLITSNKLIVVHLWLNNTHVPIKQEGNEITVDVDEITSSYEWKLLMRCVSLCNERDLLSLYDRKLTQTLKLFEEVELATLEFSSHFKKGNSYINVKSRKICNIPSAYEDTPFKITLHNVDIDSEERTDTYLMCLKGPLKLVIDCCSTILINGEAEILTDDLKLEILEQGMERNKLGERPIGFCDFEFPEGDFEFFRPEDAEVKEFRFLGFLSVIDPPKENVRDAVEKCRKAGVRVSLWTSDDSIVGKAIARDVGIISKDTETMGELSQRLNIPIDSIEPGVVQAIVLSGSKLRNTTPEELDEMIQKYSEIVFTEIDPQQKLDIVASYQRLGLVVAVTGTKVTDYPALKKADIGISLAMNSCDMSNDAADMILLDSDFSSIVSGIEKGRLVFDNIQKTICYNLTCNLPEFLPFLLLVILGIPLPLGVTSIVLIDLGFEMLPTLSLTHEKGERDIMQRNPRAAKRGQMVNSRLLKTSYLQIGIPITAAGLYTYFVVMAENGFMPEDLLGIETQWNYDSVNDLKDSYNQEWTYYSRKTLEYTCHTAFFITIVISVWFNAVMCKARQDSLKRRGMRNHVMNFSFFAEAIVVLILLYTPGMSLILHIFPIKTLWLFLGLPFNLFILAYDELRRYIVRHSEKDSWVMREIY